MNTNAPRLLAFVAVDGAMPSAGDARAGEGRREHGENRRRVVRGFSGPGPVHRRARTRDLHGKAAAGSATFRQGG